MHYLLKRIIIYKSHSFGINISKTAQRWFKNPFKKLLTQISRMFRNFLQQLSILYKTIGHPKKTRNLLTYHILFKNNQNIYYTLF